MKNLLPKNELIKLIILNLFLAGCYFLFARLGLKLATLNNSASPVWPATGFAFSIVYLFGKRVLPAVTLGAFAANLMTGGSLALTFFISIGNTLEALAGAWVIYRIQQQRKHLSYHTDTIAFSAAAVLATTVSASIGVLALKFSGVVPVDMMGAVWLTWWIGDMLGGLVVTPILVQIRKLEVDIKKWPRVLGVLLTTFGILYFVFAIPEGGSYLFLLFPILLFAIRSTCSVGILIIAAVICTVSILATVSGVGPFAVGTLNERLVHLQLFLVAFVITSLTLSGFGKEKLTRVPTLVLIVCWSLSGMLFYSFDQSEKNKTESHYSNLVGTTQEKILSVMNSYESALRGGAGLFAASQNVELSEWQAYNDALSITKHHQGMNGMGVIWPVRHDQIPQFEKEIRAQGRKNFKVKYIPEQEIAFNSSDHTHYIIKFLEPVDLNKEAIGLDVGSEKFRRDAADKSRDTMLPTITSKISLVQDAQKTPGFLLFFPLYKRNSNLMTVEERRRNHIGWIYSPVIYHKFFNEVFNQTSNEIELQAFEGAEIDKSNLLFSNFSSAVHERQNKTLTRISIGQKEILLSWRKSPWFVSSHNTIVAWVGLCGALASLLLTNLMLSLQLIGQRSRELAEELTAELSTSREKFRAGERRLLYALDGSNDGIWDWNIEKCEMYVSGKIAETHGWPQIFYVKSANDLSKFVYPDDLQQIGRSIRRVMEGKQPYHEVETRYLTTRGEWRWVLTRGKVSERNSQGVPTRMTGVHIDIHELKKTQNLLEDTQHQLRNIANSVPSLVSLWNKDLKCEFANDAFAKWYGFEPQKMLGLSIHDLISKSAFERLKNIFAQVMSGEPVQYEREVIRELDGSKRYVISTFLPNITHGENAGFFHFIQDITDLKRAELTALEERKAALDAASIKSQFLANMSHEIRTPLNGIVGMSSLLMGTSLNDKQKEYSEIISRSSEALLNIINDILDFSKVEAGKLELEIVDFNLKDLIYDVTKALTFSANEKKLPIVTKINLKTHDYYKGDPGRIRQILTNLIGNAIKFTPQGSVTIEVMADEQVNTSMLRFKVTDTGIGIPKEALGLMFQAFTQADATMTRRFGGTGLGLSICKQLVNLMGGEIGVESQDGKGSTFWFNLVLPHGDAHSSVEQLSFARIKRTAGARILIAEDNKVNQNVICINLENLSYTYDIAENGIEVLHCLENKNYDLILMDCQMPEMDGYEATEKIRSHLNPKISRIPIVALTANAMKGDRERCVAVGMNDYLTKPISIKDLSASLNKWLYGKVVKMDEQDIRNMRPESVIDMRVIQTLRDLQQPGKSNLLQTLIDLFFESAAQDMIKVRSAVKNNDLKSLASSVHGLKSSSANLGALGFASICQELEDIGEGDRSPDKIPELMTKLEEEYIQILKALKVLKAS